MNPDDKIEALLSEGPKSFTELAAKIVSAKENPNGICARGTLVAHLKSLREEDRIRKNTNPENRTTTYTLVPESMNHAKRMMDIVSLESLVNELRVEERRELEQVSKTEGMDFDVPRLFTFKNLPKMSFRLNLDEDTAKIINRITSTSDLASQLHTFVSRKLYEMRQSLPTPSEDMEELEVFLCRNWDQIQDIAYKIALKYGLSFLLLSWYDGRQYKERIMSALKEMRKLKRNHEEDVYFLDEINKRCYFLDCEYGKVPNAILEVVDRISRISDPYQLLNAAFLYNFSDQRELIGLEIALTSERIHNKLAEADFFTSLYDKSQSHPMLTYAGYADMKIPFLSEDEQNSLLKKLLAAIGKECAGIGYREEHRLAVDVLKAKLGVIAKVEVKSPVMSFQFDKDNERMDFSDEPFVREFLSFKNDSKKRKWLQKCLHLGLPVFSYIPFEKLGFEQRNIL